MCLEWQRQLTFLLCPPSPQSIPRTTGILFNSVLLAKSQHHVPVFYFSCPCPRHYNVQYHCDSWCSATGLSFPLGIFIGYGTWENLSIYSADPPEPDIDCITLQHCPKAHATYFIVPLVSLFIYLL